VRLARPQVNELITKAAKKGQKPSQIGVLLRDQHGIPLVKSVTGSKILRILKAHGESRFDLPPLSRIALFVDEWIDCAGVRVQVWRQKSRKTSTS
jgi:hypothetical protein